MSKETPREQGKMEDPKSGTWRFNRSVSVETIVLLVTFLLAGLVYSMRIEGRVDLNQSNIEINKTDISKIEDSQSSQYREITRLLERIDDKLDLKVDKPVRP